MKTALEDQSLLEKLNDPETSDSLERLLELLPSIVEKVEKLDRLIEIAEAVLEDDSTVERLKLKFDHSNIDVNTLESGYRLLGKLPFLLKVTEKFEQTALFAEEVIKDEKSIDYIIRQADNQLAPLKERFFLGKEIWERVTFEAEKNRRPITVFTMMKWIKEPQVQRFLSHVQALIYAIPDPEKKKEE